MVVLAVTLAVFAVLALFDPDFWKPIGCPFCGAPEPRETGWVKCAECQRIWRRMV